MSDSVSTPSSSSSWMKTITRYQWIVLIACYAGGMFDGLDSSLFTVILKPAVTDLTHVHTATQVSHYGAIIVALFLLGWTTGGMVFGYLSDKIGRVKALSLSILIYALAPGLCGLAHTWQELAAFRFLTALGIGGELIVGTTLLAEAWPEKYRAKIIGFLTTAYQAGVLLVGVNNYLLGHWSWRALFFVGAIPALMVMFVRRKVSEPEHWRNMDIARRDAVATEAGVFPKSGFKQLFTPEYLPRVLAGSAFTGAVLIAYWASSMWIPTWFHQLLPAAEASTQASYLLILQGLFAIGGSIWAGFLAEQIGRRFTAVIASLGYLLTSIGMFAFNPIFSETMYYWGAAMGIFIGMSISACYIFVPELFPTRIRGTGTGFCFNLGRIVAAIGVIYSSELVRIFGGSYAHAAMMISYALVIIWVTVWFAPETRGKLLQD